MSPPLDSGPTRAIHPPPPAHAVTINSRIGDYRITSVLGEGGMGTVFAAVHDVIGKQVAIKVLRTSVATSTAIERFIQEAQAVNRIGHPNIIDVFDYGVLDHGRPYYVMERLVGRSLRERLEDGPMPLGEITAVIDGVTAALTAVHAQQVIHRDLKPDNLFLVESERGMTVKLLDFGIAKLLDNPSGRVSLTETGAILGTPRYMAPEQAREQPLTAAADVYALGGILFEMLTGHPPFQADNAAELVVMHLTEPPPRLPKVMRAPRALDQLVTSMLAKEPESRPSLVEIRRICNSAINGKRAARSVWLGVAAALLAIIGALIGIWQMQLDNVEVHPAIPTAAHPASVAQPMPSAPAQVSATPRATPDLEPAPAIAPVSDEPRMRRPRVEQAATRTEISPKRPARKLPVAAPVPPASESPPVVEPPAGPRPPKRLDRDALLPDPYNPEVP